MPLPLSADALQCQNKNDRRRLWPGGHSTQTTHAITNYLIYYSNLYKHVGAVVA